MNEVDIKHPDRGKRLCSNTDGFGDAFITVCRLRCRASRPQSWTRWRFELCFVHSRVKTPILQWLIQSTAPHSSEAVKRTKIALNDYPKTVPNFGVTVDWVDANTCRPTRIVCGMLLDCTNWNPDRQTAATREGTK